MQISDAICTCLHARLSKEGMMNNCLPSYFQYGVIILKQFSTQAHIFIKALKEVWGIFRGGSFEWW